jgi:membrane protein DedA with SNARE-associated domain
MSFRTFVAFNAIGAFAWAVVFGLLGYYFGRDLPLLERLISSLSLVVLIVAGLAILGFVWIKKRRNGSLVQNRRTEAIGESKSEPSKVEGAG